MTIEPGTLCRIVRLGGLYAAANNHFVTTTTAYAGMDGCPCWEFAPPVIILVSFPFERAALYGVPAANLQPIADPKTCSLTDAQVRARGPLPIERPIREVVRR